MPGVVLLGKTWRWGTDDLPFPALVHASLQLTWAVVLAIYIPEFDTSSAINSTCKNARTHVIVLLTLFCAMCGGFAISISIFCLSMRGSIWEARKRILVVYLIPFDMLSFVCTFFCTVVSTVLVIDVNAECLEGKEGEYDPTNVVRATIVYGWVIAFLQVVSAILSYKAFPRLDDSESLVARRKYLDAMCCFGGVLGQFDEIDNGTGELENALADVLVSFFGESHMTLSDLLCSVQLVGHWQDKEREEKVQQLILGMGQSQDQSVGRAISSYFVTPPGAAYKKILKLSSRSHSQLHGRVGVQDIVEATHYLKFAVAAYGAKLYVFASRSWFGGALYLGGRAAARSIKLRTTVEGIQKHTGQGGKNSVDALEKEAILEFAGVPEEDLVYISAENERNNLLPYFIALDHKSHSVVLGIRGTMSIADCLTDVQFDPVPIDAWLESDSSSMPDLGNSRHGTDQDMRREPAPGPHAHRGILTSACAVLEDLQGHQILEELLLTGRYTGGASDKDPLVRSESGFQGVMSSLRNFLSAPLAGASAEVRQTGDGYQSPEEGSLLEEPGASQRSSTKQKPGCGHVDSRPDTASHHSMSPPSRIPRQVAEEGLGLVDVNNFKGVIFVPKGGIVLESQGQHAPAVEVQPAAPPSESTSSTPRRKIRRKDEVKRQASQIFKDRMASHKGEWRLVVTGHSLGAGVAALVALKLKRRFPSLVCWAFAAPGALISRDVAASMESYCTNVTIGKDWVSRLNLRNAYRLWNDLMKASTHCRKPKFSVLMRGLFWHASPEYRQTLFYSDDDLPEEPARVWSHFCSTRPDNLESGVVAPALSFISPGRTLFLRPEKTGKGNKITGYDPVWLPPGVLQDEGLLISKRCFADHMPDFTLFTVRKLMKKMVAEMLPEPGDGLQAGDFVVGAENGTLISSDPMESSASEEKILRAWAASSGGSHGSANMSKYMEPRLQIDILEEKAEGSGLSQEALLAPAVLREVGQCSSLAASTTAQAVGLTVAEGNGGAVEGASESPVHGEAAV
mmetsp:Transcript_1668/g.4797  ORF Transcript_1668/g.4797 Transcript_1668/m.4797 type:complete len:1023 (+) Transcript_1668:344-3412(+)|eukprot:CAMPEP_0117655392 /NCGR_PEP_ID=MMETSP0804-20121206/4254_1 /TAXON_ID=1074897 /ORGANISM="Tetraselmis astigmatica, Strain CCMP880" /LENGTH=1022 /DNA_ID=CAMNT_0005461739 /DNA_START=320 /DNA_END=3388 /DNA_ORIENTATION=-